MKIKAFVLMGAFLAMGFLTKAQATDQSISKPSFDLGTPRSDFAIAESTVAVSSQTCTTIPAYPGFNRIIISNLNFGATMFYRVDGSSVAVATVGQPILPNTTEIIDTGSDVNVTLAAGVTNKDARVKRINKN